MRSRFCNGKWWTAMPSFRRIRTYRFHQRGPRPHTVQVHLLQELALACVLDRKVQSEISQAGWLECSLSTLTEASRKEDIGENESDIHFSDTANSRGRIESPAWFDQNQLQQAVLVAAIHGTET